MKRFLAFILLFISVGASASHIVGGEFEVLYLSPNLYKINFILYFDLNGQPGAKDSEVIARIYRKSDNMIMDDIWLPLTSENKVAYTQPGCARSELKTQRIIYSNIIEMSDSRYGDPEGYYLVWERCCRNYNTNANNASAPKLVNIISQDPTGNPNSTNAAGQTFYLEFPPVVKDGVPFINSTPRLFPPLSDFACAGQPFYADFSGSDDDEDSLVYEMVTPLNTHSAVAIPPNGPGPAPYEDVKWREPFSLNNITGGPLNLTITRDGVLRVVPGNIIGLYVFAVKCTEYRDGVKIGEVRRDFQMYVLDCPMYNAPEIKGKKLTDDGFNYVDNMSITFPNTTPDENRCIEVEITDKDIFTEPIEFVKIRVVPIGFKADISGILPEVINDTLSTVSPAAKFRVCFDKCPIVNRPFQIGIIAADNSCAVPMLDTLKVTVTVVPPANERAEFTSINVAQTVPEGPYNFSWPVNGTDDDGDTLTIQSLTDGFILSDAGMQLVDSLMQPGTYKGGFIWNVDCSLFDFTQRTNFPVTLLLDDLDECSLNAPDTMTLNLNITLPHNSPPELFINGLTQEELLNGVDRKIFESLDFQALGTDGDQDTLQLMLTGLEFDPWEHGVNFSNATGIGSVSSPFNWDLTCDKVNLADQSLFTFRFILIDENNKCRFNYRDTVDVMVNVLPPDNEAPVLTMSNLKPEMPFNNGQLTVIVGQEVSLNLTGEDPSIPLDHLHLHLLSATGSTEPQGYNFTTATGDGSVQAPFTWTPNCSIFTNGDFDNDYTFKFRVTDNRCFNTLADTLELDISISDVDSEADEFLPPNIITPNNDGCNDFFALEGFDWDESGSGGEGTCGTIITPRLPKDNCLGRFNMIRIYNRWGKAVFESTQRNFRWYAPSESAGVYFYTIVFSNPETKDQNTEYKGTITVRF